MGALQHIWTVLTGPNNDPVVLGLIFGWLALLLSHIRVYFNYRAVLRAKDAHIEDLVKQRNKFQNLILRERNSRGGARSTAATPS